MGEFSDKLGQFWPEIKTIAIKKGKQNIKIPPKKAIGNQGLLKRPLSGPEDASFQDRSGKKKAARRLGPPASKTKTNCL